MIKAIIQLVLVVMIIFSVSNSAFAYIDPGTGGTIYSFLAPLIGALLAAFVWVSGYFRKIYTFVKGFFFKASQ